MRDSRHAILSECEPLVQRLAERFHSLAPAAPLEGLVESGRVAVLRAFDQFDVSDRTEWTALVTEFLLGEMRSYLRDLGMVVPASRARPADIDQEEWG